MRVDVTRLQASEVDGAAAALLGAEPYLAYANFAPIAGREGALQQLHRRHLQTAMDGLGVLLCRDAAGQPLALLRLQEREFESRHFGMPMANVDVPVAVADEDRRLAALRALYAETAALLRSRGYRTATAAVSTQDRIGCWAIQEAGAFHVGTRISWMQPLTGARQAHQLPPGLRIEHYDRAHIADLPRRSWQRLLDWTGTAFDRGPFVFDLTVPRDRSTRVYQVWTEKALSGEWADVVIVVRDGDEVVAFHTMLLLPELSEAAGVAIVGRGIGGTLPGYRGLFTALQKECAAARPLGAAYLENECQASTIQSIQVFGKLGHQCIRSVMSFHQRLDGGGGRAHPLP